MYRKVVSGQGILFENRSDSLLMKSERLRNELGPSKAEVTVSVEYSSVNPIPRRIVLLKMP